MILEGAPDERITFEVITNKGTVTRREEGGNRLEVKLAPADGAYLRVRMRAANGTRAWSQPLFRGF